MAMSSMKMSALFKRLIPLRVSKKYNVITDKMKFGLPERFKGTVVEKWANFWKNLLRDYQEVWQDTSKDIRERPKRALAFTWAFAAWWYCMKTNPDAQSFRDQVLTQTTEISSLPASVRRRESSDHLIFLESCYNSGLIRRLNLGIASLMWIDNYHQSVGLYPAQCKYLEPEYLSFYKRVVDVGFLGRWWIINHKMIDSDVNSDEWERSGK